MPPAMDLLHLIKTDDGTTARAAPADNGFSDLTAESAEQQEFLEKVDAIQNSIQRMNDQQDQVLKLFEDSKALVNAKQIRSNREAMTAQVQEIQVAALKVKNQIQQLDKENEQWLKEQPEGTRPGFERVRENVTMGLRKKLQDTLTNFNAMREKIHDYHKETVKQRVYTVTGEHMNDDQAEALLTGGAGDDIFKTAMQNMDRHKAQLALDEINKKNDDMKGLEQSLLELHQVFLDMAVLVESQQAIVDNIEKNMQRARSYAEVGVKHVTEAKKLYQSINKKKVICWTIIVICIILLAVFAGLMIWNFTKS